MDHDELRSLIPAYALGAVAEDEVGMIRDHILSCEECMAEADRLSEATGSLALAVEPVALSDGFADRVVALARPDAEEEPGPLRLVPSRWQRWSALVAAVATGAALVLGVLYLNARNDLASERELVRAAQVLRAPGGLTLTGEDVVAKAATVDDGSLFAATGLDTAPAGKTYELWLMRGPGCPSTTAPDCEVISAGTFEPSDGVAVLELDHFADDWDHAAVTVERDGGAEDGPTTAPIAASFSA
ncbi:MAG: anti-sigma factor [Actinomycetota bacterium]